MSWTEQQTATRDIVDVDKAKARLFDEVKKESLPVVQKEADGGVRPFKTVQFQPVKGVRTFEAEFGVKGDDVIFHVWPWGYHEKDRDDGHRLPEFPKDFEQTLKKAMGKVFGENRVSLSYDGDVGAWFVMAKGFALNQFHRNLCIEAAQALHTAMGGES